MPQAQAQAQEVRVMGARSDHDPGNNYFIALTKLVLSKAAQAQPNDSVKIINTNRVTQGRLFRFIDDDLIDVVWSGTNSVREKSYLPIKIPLVRGLLGYRVLLVHKENTKKIKHLNNEAELKAMVACQGAHWPDADILEDNGYNVSRVVHYDAMFKMLERKRCDFFPRAIFEGRAEFNNIKDKYPNIRLVENILLQYPLPMYFFVKQGNHALAKRLSDGLTTAMNDGSMLKLMKSHELTSFIFPITQWDNAKVFRLLNFNLPAETPLNNAKLWFVLGNHNSG